MCGRSEQIHWTLAKFSQYLHKHLGVGREFRKRNASSHWVWHCIVARQATVPINQARVQCLSAPWWLRQAVGLSWIATKFGFSAPSAKPTQQMAFSWLAAHMGGIVLCCCTQGFIAIFQIHGMAKRAWNAGFSMRCFWNCDNSKQAMWYEVNACEIQLSSGVGWTFCRDYRQAPQKNILKS